MPWGGGARRAMGETCIRCHNVAVLPRVNMHIYAVYGCFSARIYDPPQKHFKPIFGTGII